MADDQELDRLRRPDEARATILAKARPLGTEDVPLVEAAGRIVARDIVARENHPPFAAATMDGFAVVAEDDSPWREIVGDQTAGYVLDVEVTPGTAIRITTGAPVPRGATAVVRVEDTEAAEDHVVVRRERIVAGENVRPVGVDVRAGEVVVRAGSLLGPPELGQAAALGVTPISVYRRPRVSVLSTGDELVEPGDEVPFGKIRDSNRFSLIAALNEFGAELVWSGKAPDARDRLRGLLVERIEASDVVLTSGGVSMGELDLIKPLLGEVAEVHFRRVFMKPGKPLNFATAGEKLIFGLPGNPVSALVSFEIFIRPALATLEGRRDVDRPRIHVTLAHDTAPSDRIEYQRALVGVDADGRLIARTTGAQASSRLASLIGANALLIIPPRSEEFRAGELVEAILLDLPIGNLPT